MLTISNGPMPPADTSEHISQDGLLCSLMFPHIKPDQSVLLSVVEISQTHLAGGRGLDCGLAAGLTPLWQTGRSPAVSWASNINRQTAIVIILTITATYSRLLGAIAGGISDKTRSNRKLRTRDLSLGCIYIDKSVDDFGIGLGATGANV
jgi:hypothetical protein